MKQKSKRKPKKILPFTEIVFADDLNKLGTLETLKEEQKILEEKEKKMVTT